MKLISILLLISSLSYVDGQCININTPPISNILNSTFHENCYKHTVDHFDCCDNFMLNNYCIDTYKECIQYEHYVLKNVYDQCHNFNKTIEI